jgi:hypothetical protein
VYPLIPQYCNINLFIYWLGRMCVHVRAYHLSVGYMPTALHTA